MSSESTVTAVYDIVYVECIVSFNLIIIEHGTIIYSPTVALIDVGLVLVCFLRSSAMLKAIAETNVATMMMVTMMTAMVMTMLSGSVAELCCTEI